MASYKRILGGWARTDSSQGDVPAGGPLPVVGRRLESPHEPSPPHLLEGPAVERPREEAQARVENEPEDHRRQSARNPTVEVDLEAVEQLRHQARQLAVHLREKQDELDRREAEWQAQLAAFDNQRRSAQVWYLQRCRELEDRETAIPIRERELANQRELLIAAEAASVQVRQNDEAALVRKAEALEIRATALIEKESELEQQTLHAALEAAARRHAAAEVDARRQELQAEIDRLRDQEAELELRRAAVERLQNEPSRYQVELQKELNGRVESFDAREAAVVEQEENLKQAMLEWQRLRGVE
ncbi:MAG: hypothetical protein QM775_31990 [Pirellulales bacterium]